ncbi:MAG: pilus assembly protein [Sphingomonadaceae bacterium]|nr:pilus assembly protein [Sphingomonadaceae bacterium]
MNARLALHRLARDQRGATLTEFGFVLVPLCLVLLGSLDVGYQAYVRSVAQGALNEVSRRAAVEDPVFGGAGDTVEEQIAEELEERVDEIARNATYDIQTTNFYEFSGVGDAEKLTTDHNENGEYDEDDEDCFEDFNENGEFDEDGGDEGVGGADDVANYVATITMPRLFPMAALFGFSDNYTIVARASVRNQPYADQDVPPTVCGNS